MSISDEERQQDEAALEAEFKQLPDETKEKFQNDVYADPEGVYAGIKARVFSEVFVDTHPRYAPSVSNSKKMIAYLQENKLPPTYESMVEAYEALVAANQLELVSEEDVPPVKLSESQTAILRQADRMTADEFTRRINADKNFRIRWEEADAANQGIKGNPLEYRSRRQSQEELPTVTLSDGQTFSERDLDLMPTAEYKRIMIEHPSDAKKINAFLEKTAQRKLYRQPRLDD